MKIRTITVIFGFLLFCCAATLCVASYFYLTSINKSIVPPVDNSPQANITATVVVPSPSQTQTPALACPNLLARIVKASQGTAYDGASSKNAAWHTLVTYQVTADQIGSPAYEKVSKTMKRLQQDSAAQHAAWNLFTGLIPPEDRQMVSAYQVFTDGPGNILAAVEQTPNDPAKWMLEVDDADLQNKKELVFTLVHEYAHLLTLNDKQVPPDVAVFNNPDDQDLYAKKVAACPTYFPSEGCSKPNSYINAFYQRFWTGIADEWKKVDALSAASDQNQYYDELYTFYKAHQDQFVDDYAATNASEDIAETFAYYILSPKPAGASIRDQKILFFYDYPELVQLRSQIQNNVCALNP